MHASSLVVLVVVAGCTSYDQPWQIRVGLAPQPVARAELGIDEQADVGLGELWVSIHAWDAGDVAYPVVPDVATGGLEVVSAFDPALPLGAGPADSLPITTRLSRDAEPAEQHPTLQFATVFIDARLDPRLRSQAAGPLSSGQATLQLELEITVPKACDPPPAELSGTVAGCLANTGSCGTVTLARQGGAYRAGPFQIWLNVLPQNCLE